MKKHNTMKVVLLVVTALWLISALFLPDKDWGVLVKCGLSLVELFLMLFALKEKNNALKVVLVTIFALCVLAWILPAAYYSGEYIDQGRTQIGLFDVFNYSLTSLSYFGYIGLFIVLVGGFYGILYKIPAYRSFLDKIVAICKGKEALTLSIIMVVLALITSVCGLQMGLLLFFPMLAAVILLMGYDKIVVALTLVGSTMIGMAGTTFGHTNTEVLNSSLGLDIMKTAPINFLFLVLGLALLIFNTLWYAKKANNVSKTALKAAKTVVKSENEVVEVKAEKKVSVKKTTSKTTAKSSAKKTTTAKKASSTKSTSTKKASSSKGKSSSKSSRKDIKAAAKGDDVIVVKESLVNDSMEKFVPTMVDSKHKIWPIVTGFIIMFIVMLLAFIPWADVFKNDMFVGMSEGVATFKLFGFEFFGKLLGTFNPFGQWTINDLFFVMAAISALLTIIYKVEVDDALEGFVNGAKKAMVPALVALLVYTVLVITTYHPYQLAIYKALLNITKGFNIVPSAIVALLTGLFNQDPAYSFQAVLPYFTGVITNSGVYETAGLLFQSLYGIVMLVAPTGLILMVVLAYLEVSYKEWLKAIWKLLVELLLVSLVVGAIGIVFGFAGISNVIVVILKVIGIIALIGLPLTLAVFTIIAYWKMYKKAGKAGWASIVPFYHDYVLCEIGGLNGWMFLLEFVPIANIVLAVIVCKNIAKAFDKGIGYTLGLLFLNPFFVLPLGFGKLIYTKPTK
ncbi:MAG: hypothetical protein IJA30_01125 [Bacilli bacterium]|nr:hypothetical protein [Bacilli bacterium]